MKPKVTLIELSTYNTEAIGARILASVAAREGFDRDVIFMCGDNEYNPTDTEIRSVYGQGAVDQILEIATGSSLVGVSFFTNYYNGAVQLTNAIKNRLGIPVIWGGVHTTACPDDSLKHADIVCMGEGDGSFAELLSRIKAGAPIHDVRGMWFRKNGDMVKNPWRELEPDLDKIPFQDYNFEGQYFYNKLKGAVQPLRYDDFRMLSGHAYNTMMTRGCPSVCSFCYNSTWRDKYGGRYVRSRSVDNMIAELTQIKERFPFIKLVMFADDNFFAKSGKVFDEFAEKYPKQVGLNFWAQITPNSVNERRVEKAAIAGLRSISMGVQTASGKIRKIFDRSDVNNEQILDATRALGRIYKKYKHQDMQPPAYDFILDTYWEDKSDARQNLELILEFPKPYTLHLASLVPYPGSKIYDRVKAENLIKDEMREIYHRPFMDKNMVGLCRTFVNLLMVYCEILPQFMLRALAGGRRLDFFERHTPVFVIDKLIRGKSRLDRLFRLMNMIRNREFSKITAIMSRIFMARHQ